MKDPIFRNSHRKLKKEPQLFEQIYVELLEIVCESLV